MPQHIRENVFTNHPTFDYRDYIYPDSFIRDIKVGDIFYYITKTTTEDKIDKFKLVITDKHHESCNNCPLIRHHCEGLDCNIQVRSVLHIK